jgi:hypothetical protein
LCSGPPVSRRTRAKRRPRRTTRRAVDREPGPHL